MNTLNPDDQNTQDATFPHAAVFKPQSSQCRYFQLWLSLGSSGPRYLGRRRNTTCTKLSVSVFKPSFCLKICKYIVCTVLCSPYTHCIIYCRSTITFFLFIYMIKDGKHPSSISVPYSRPLRTYSPPKGVQLMTIQIPNRPWRPNIEPRRPTLLRMRSTRPCTPSPMRHLRNVNMVDERGWDCIYVCWTDGLRGPEFLAEKVDKRGQTETYYLLPLSVPPPGPAPLPRRATDTDKVWVVADL